MGSKVMWTFRIVMMLTSLVTVIYLIQYLHSGGLEKSKNPMMELLGAGSNGSDGSGGSSGDVGGGGESNGGGGGNCSEGSAAANTNNSGICKVDSAVSSSSGSVDKNHEDGINARVIIGHKRSVQAPTEKSESAQGLKPTTNTNSTR